MAGQLGFVDAGQQAAATGGEVHGDVDAGWNTDIGLIDLLPGGWLIKKMTGNFGADQNAAAIDRASKAQMAFQQKALDAAQAAGGQAQAGLDPYAQAGQNALQQQQALAGALGPEAQAAAVQALQSSPAFQQQLDAGNRNLLQNASATGGLRGGDAQRGLAELAPQLLQSMVQQQLAALGGLSGQGLQAATQQGAFGLNAAGMQADVLQQQGQAAAGGIIGQQQAINAGNARGDQLAYQGIGAAGSLIGVPNIGPIPRQSSGSPQPFGAF